jgi:hypothetical protein
MITAKQARKNQKNLTEDQIKSELEYRIAVLDFGIEYSSKNTKKTSYGFLSAQYGDPDHKDIHEELSKIYRSRGFKTSTQAWHGFIFFVVSWETLDKPTNEPG